MQYRTLLKSNFIKHRYSLLGIAFLFLILSVCLTSILSIWMNAENYISNEMNRLHYGTISTWVSNIDTITPLEQQIQNIEIVDRVNHQQIIFADYEIHAKQSDSEGQIVVYTPNAYDYRFFSDDLSSYQNSPRSIGSHEIYVCASLSSMYGVQIGDTIQFKIGRNNVSYNFQIKGFFEDPIMGSSMIGMKSFLISQNDYDAIASSITQSGTNALARTGYILHITQNTKTSLTHLNTLLHESTDISRYTEFTYSQSTLQGFMMTLLNVFTSITLGIVCVLLVVSCVVISYNIASMIEQDYFDMSILKKIGFTTLQLRIVQISLYLFIMIPSIFLGILFAIAITPMISNLLIPTIGVKIPSMIDFTFLSLTYSTMLLLFILFIYWKTHRMHSITPIQIQQKSTQKMHILPLQKNCLLFSMALRQVHSQKKRYTYTCIITTLLVFFASLLGRVNTWLGPNGEGLMNAFNPADLDIAIQPMSTIDMDAVENSLQQYTTVLDSYQLAMPSVSIDGMDVSANVITDSQRFHILEGNTISSPHEIVITEFLANDLQVSIHDTVTISSINSDEYTIVGIYQCANEMGVNIGMSKEGYSLIGQEIENMWCHHYFISNPEQKPQIIQQLENTYQSAIYIHEKSWPGLQGILQVMHFTIIFFYCMISIFIFVVTSLTTNRLLYIEKEDISYYQTIGFTSFQLRISFCMRFGIVSIIGGVIGILCSATLSDSIVSTIMRLEGISNFSSTPTIVQMILPMLFVTSLYVIYAWIHTRAILHP